MLKNKWALIITVLVILINNVVTGQSYNDSLIIKFRNLSVISNTDVLKANYSDSLRVQIKVFLESENSFVTPMNKVPYLGDIHSPDDAFRMVTWNISLKDGTYDYYCFIQLAPDKNGNSEWFELIDHHKETRRPEYRSLNSENWYGALYYSIIPFKKDKQTMYVLLGWEGNTKFANKKIIESLYFNKKGEPNFGKSVFETNRMNKRRVVFEYSKEAYMMVRYNEKMKQIIFNRLEPSKPDLKGLYQFYQPILIYDAYKYKKGNWVLLRNVQPQNKKNDKEFHNPKDLKHPKK